MPSRRGLPTLSIFSRHSAPPTTTSPPQPSPRRSSVPPVTPPARLHLRNLLPTSPEGMPTPPLPPRQPYAWLWQCHSCSTVYRIGCTRRCLVCSHEYCVSASPLKATRGKKRRRASGMCASEFDYSGWADWGAWRRKVLGLEVAGRTGERQREQAFCDQTHNCIIDCDYPSECHHERYRLHTEALERRMLEESQRLEEPQSPSINRRRRLSTDDKIPLDEEIVIEERKEEKEEQKSPTSPKSPLSQTSFFWDEPESRGGDEKAWWVDSERSEMKKRKTKSQQKIEQLTGLGVIPEETAEAMDPEMLQSLIEEDREMMPLEVVGESLIRRSKYSFSCRERLGHRRKSSVRSLASVEEWEEWEDSSDSESDDSSVLSSPPSCSNTITSASEVSSEESHDGTEEGLDEERDKELNQLVTARKSFLRD